ncbi:tetraspanin-4a isoform X1 [Danio rerio]|uniref:Tetraspanin-4 n=3 Tax=Danio rerio TaxID=7955 RepID=A0A8M3B373_DANRE|nr:tetraspanin-4 isoform X1 [Danio rerio]XP_009292177.1 tetraspanin-4 isoform X1 [Danio rerio]|eukprot:XP_009292176.1 tetraspanin-4 isoform X1 [Danio rerio]
MRRSSTDETPYRRSPSLDSKSGSPPLRYSGEYEYHSSPFVFGLRTTPGPKTKANYTSAQGRKYVVFYLDLSFIFLLELRRCRMAEGCLRALRYGMVFFNLLFWLCGCGILGVGVWLSITQGNFATLSSSLPSLSAANLLIAAGTVVMVIGCLGCVGAVKENRPLLLSFFILLLLIFLLEILFIILFFSYQDQIDLYAQNDLKKGLQLFGTEGNIGLTNAWSIVQTDFRCCGVTNHTDWFQVYNTSRVPDSCCLEYSDNCGLENPGTWWTAPCYERVKGWLQENLVALWIFALCTALTQILGLVFSMTIFCHTVKAADTYYA